MLRAALRCEQGTCNEAVELEIGLLKACKLLNNSFDKVWKGIYSRWTSSKDSQHSGKYRNQNDLS